jgi:hypothetical protein
MTISITIGRNKRGTTTPLHREDWGNFKADVLCLFKAVYTTAEGKGYDTTTGESEPTFIVVGEPYQTIGDTLQDAHVLAVRYDQETVLVSAVTPLNLEG